ncbi:hypothetical protein CPSG_09901 [Coccidioides posadasii str. Silveira]|uniref:Uncharacterized protein n=1 Tax=Coccidioides posadasii (strain RMSCC 757 / Silveira) TaxID=443226 RepID=E9DJA2_COCPS|nr:hypothetical protein CPSG_09901 [Coccidioides posadasii str. Silveira]
MTATSKRETGGSAAKKWRRSESAGNARGTTTGPRRRTREGEGTAVTRISSSLYII